MAIDKNSKAYQTLINKWYSDEQITQMHSAANSGQATAKEVVTRTTPQYENQGSGNYVYNESTGYYENTSKPAAPIQQTKQETPVQETQQVVKQQETPASTVSEVKQEGSLKPLSQEYYNQTSEAAQNTIRDNLNRYKQTNPEYFTDYESFKKNFSYDTRSDEQKNTLDTWYNWYQESLQLASTPVADLYTQYKNGSLSVAQLEELRISDPAKYGELQNQINKGNIIAAYDDDKGSEGTGLSIQDMAYQMLQQTFMQFMNGENTSGASQYFRDYEEKMESPEMTTLSDQCTEVQNEIENVQADLESIKKSVEAEYAGTGASRAKINAIISDRSYDLQLQLRTLNSEYNKYATQYNNRMQQYQTEFTMQLQEYQLGQQERQQKMQELGFALDLMSFETPQQAQDREWQYRVKQQEYANGNINSTDYQTRYKAALTSVQNLLSQYEGIPMQRSAEQMAQDILKAIDEGSDLGTELTKINKLIQEKPEYKVMYNATFYPQSSSSGGVSGMIEETMKVGDEEWYKYNGQRYTAEQFNNMLKGGSTGTAKPYDVVDAALLQNRPGALYTDANWNLVGTGNNLWKFLIQSKNLNGNKGGQCGKFVNDYLQFIWMTSGTNRYYDDNLSTKINSINTYDPKVGTVAVFDYNHKSSDWINHGHVGIVTKVTNDGIYVRDSNYGSDEKIQTRFIAKDSAEWNNNLKGFFDPSRPALGGTTETDSKSTVSESDKIRADSILKQIKTWVITPSDASKERDWLIEKWYGQEFQEALDKGMKVSLTPVQVSQKTETLNRFNASNIVKDFKDASVQINGLIDSLDANNGAGDLAWIFQFMKVLDPSSVVREGEFKNAAKTAWYANPEALWQQYVKHGWDGTWLTQAQRGNFKELAKSLIKSQAEFYNIEYQQVVKDFQNAGIDNQWLPINYAEVITNKLDGKNIMSDPAQQSLSVRQNLQLKYWLK